MTVRVERPATGGGVGRADDGRVIFVRHSLPGELVRVALTETTASFYRGEAIEIVEASPERVTPPCPYAHPGGCGGCDLQHASIAAQLSWKASLVEEHLRRIAGIDMSIEVMAMPGTAKGTRTRLRCAVDDDGQLSLRQARSHDLVAINPCWIADESLAPAFNASWAGNSEVELRAIGEGTPFAVAQRLSERGTTYELRGLSGATLDPATQSRVNVAGHVY